MADGEFDFTSDMGSGAEAISQGGPIATGGGDGGGSGFGDFARNLWSGMPSWSDFGSFAKGLLPVAQLGTGVLGAVTGARAAGQNATMTRLAEEAAKRQGDVSRTAQASAQPFQEFGVSELERAKAGQVDPAIESQIQQWKQGALQQARDFAARTGQGDSTMLKSWEAWIEQQAIAMRSQAIQQMEQLALQAGQTGGQLLGTAGSAAGGSGQTAAGQQQGIEQLIAASNQVLARLNASAS